MFVAFVDNPRQRINIPTNVYVNICLIFIYKIQMMNLILTKLRPYESRKNIPVKVINFSTKREYIFPHSTVLCSLCVKFVEQCLKHECETEEAARKKKFKIVE